MLSKRLSSKWPHSVLLLIDRYSRHRKTKAARYARYSINVNIGAAMDESIPFRRLKNHQEM
jgi:hypothetical protein